MRGVVVLWLLVSCTKPNPNRCCTDEAACTSHGVPVGQTCTGGLVCRGNECVAETCSTFADCDLSAPYCVMQLCGASCTDDTQCPGNGRDPGDLYCVSGTCLACRT